MTAMTTALRVLTWAAAPHGTPPIGPLWDAAELARPVPAVRDAAAELARRTAARIGAGTPPLGSADQIGLGVIFLAAAVGGRRQADPALTLAQTLPPPAARHGSAWYDLVARHGLVGAALSGLPGTGTEAPPAQAADSHKSLPEALLTVSPLSAVLYRPPLHALRAGTTRQAVSTAIALLSRPRGRQVLATGLADWLPFPAVLAWRTELLSRLRLDHRDLVLDVYLVARLRFGAEWDRRIQWARRQLRSRGAPDPLAIATLRFWAPLAALQRDTSLSALRPLMTGHDTAVDLVRQHHLDQAGAA